MKLPRENTVFIIDDDIDVGQSTVTLVQIQGLRTALFNSAEDFLAGTENTIFGCVISDHLLEGKWSGIDLLKHMKILGYRIPVIIASGSLNHSSKTAAKKLGAFAVIEKPYSSQRLYETVKAALNKLD